MLLMMNLDSTVWVIEGVKHQEGEHEGRKAMHKICTALNKEKGIASLTKSVTILNSKITIKCCRYYKSHAGLCQDVSNAQKLRRIKQRKEHFSKSNYIADQLLENPISDSISCSVKQVLFIRSLISTDNCALNKSKS